MQTTFIAPRDCPDCKGSGRIRPDGLFGPAIECRDCHGRGRRQERPPYSVAWLRGEEDNEARIDCDLLECEPLRSGIPDRETAIAAAMSNARNLGCAYLGGRVVVSDSRGDRVFDAECVSRILMETE